MGMPLPRLTSENLRNAVLEMCEQAGEMLRLARAGFQHASASSLDRVGTLSREVHLREKRLTEHIAMQIREYPWSLGPAEHLAFLPAALERIADSADALAERARRIRGEGIPISERGVNEIMTLFSRVLDLLVEVMQAIRTGDRGRTIVLREAGERFQALCDEVASRHQDRLIHGVCAPRASSIFLAMLDSFREIERYTRRMSGDLEKALTAG